MNLIETKLPKDIWPLAQKFDIPDEFLEKMPDLIEMVLRSKSLEKDEDKQSWFNLLPLMTTEQIDKLRDILNREKQKLDEIEKKYEQKKVEIKKKYLLRWQSMGYTNKVAEIKKQESQNEEQEQVEADNLLNQI